MGIRIDTEPLESYGNRVDLFELYGELNGYDYAASGEVGSEDELEDLSELSELDVQEESDTYRGIEVQVLFSDEHYDEVGEVLF